MDYKLKAGSWIRVPIQYDRRCQTEQTGAYHHAIIICPLLEIGFNAAGSIIDKLHVTSSGDLYDCSLYEIIKEPKDYEHCEEILRRALKYYGARKYNQMFNNCEHFASYCFTGKSESKQVKQSLWSGTSKFYRFIQSSSLMANAALFLNGYDLVSDEFVDKLCIADHQIGKLNGKLADFCDDRVESNKMENVYDIQKVGAAQEEKQDEDCKVKGMVQEAQFIRSFIKKHRNAKGRIEAQEISQIMESVKIITSKYYVGYNTLSTKLFEILRTVLPCPDQDDKISISVFMARNIIEFL